MRIAIFLAKIDASLNFIFGEFIFKKQFCRRHGQKNFYLHSFASLRQVFLNPG